MGVPETSVEIPIRAILHVKARVLRTNVEIRRLAYGRETSVASLVGCCAHRATRVRKKERAWSLVSTESDEPMPREEQYGGGYGGGGANGVYDLVFLHAAQAGSGTCIAEFWLCCEGVLFSYVTAKKKRSFERVHVCAGSLTLQHVSLLTLQGMIISFLVVPTTAVETNRVYIDYFLPLPFTSGETNGVHVDGFLLPPPTAV